MKGRILLLDFDGVINVSRYFSEIYAEEFGIDVNKMIPFFKNMKDTANLGKADLAVLLNDVLDEWEWKGSVEELISYWLNSDVNIDERVKNLAIELKNKGVSIYLATDQERRRGEFIWNEKGLKDWMDGNFFSYDIGATKEEPLFFQSIIKKLNIDPKDIIFFDDSESKVEAAIQQGITGYVYKNFEDFEDIIKKNF